MKSESIQSWGRTFRLSNIRQSTISWIDEINFNQKQYYLPYGQGRSYGDCCLLEGGVQIATSKLNRLINFEQQKGIVKVESGITLHELLNFLVPKGWFIPVTPGTKEVSIGGAIANDVHGKNHHISGTIGRYIVEMELLRSNGERLICSPSSNSDLYSATIAGLGLTGILLSATLRLKKVSSAYLVCKNISFRDIQEFFELSAKFSQEYEYCVAWIDCAAKGKNFGRGILMCGMHDEKSRKIPFKKSSNGISIPFEMPEWFLNSWMAKRFNELYYYLKGRSDNQFNSHYDPFFYPLDVAKKWNRLYGKRGFFQFQCVVPSIDDNRALRGLLKLVKESEFSSYLAVLKEFGDLPSPGMMSFPRPGMTLCLDFPNLGERMLSFLGKLNHYAIEQGGAIYPAKDATMTREQFKAAYPKLDNFRKYIDPNFSSSFWQRVSS